MSSENATDTVPTTQSLNVIVHPALNYLMISHTFLVLLVPLVVSLFHYSSPKSRRRILFLLNLAAISLAFSVGILIDIYAIHAILEPLNPMPLSINIAIGFLGVWQSIIVDLTLLVRLIFVYPPRHIGLLRFSLLIAIPVLLKLARTINIIMFIVAIVEAANGPNGAVMAGIVFSEKPYLKIEWATQMIDNTYVSLAFLWRIRVRENKPVKTASTHTSLAQRMQTLFYIALTTFVVPAMFSIAQFISVYRGVGQIVLDDLMLVNTMLATFGVAFATIWGYNSSQEAERVPDQKRDNTSYLMRIFEFGPVRKPFQSSAATASGSWNSERVERSNA